LIIPAATSGPAAADGRAVQPHEMIERRVPLQIDRRLRPGQHRDRRRRRIPARRRPERDQIPIGLCVHEVEKPELTQIIEAFRAVGGRAGILHRGEQ
jgi:hypothetical protein